MDIVRWTARSCGDRMALLARIAVATVITLGLLAFAPRARADQITFEAEIPYCTPQADVVYLRSNRSDAETFGHDALERIDATHVRGTFEVTTPRAEFRYKYSRGECTDAACPGIEKALDYTGTGGDVADRTVADGVTDVHDLVYIWRDALAIFDEAGQKIGERSDADHVAFCAPYLSIGTTEGGISISYDSFGAGEVVLDYGPTTTYGTQVVRSGNHRNVFEVDDLEPGNLVHYRITENGVAGPDNTFVAPPAPGMPFRFAFLGDAQYYAEDNRVAQRAFVDIALEFDPDLVLSPGDLVASENPGDGWIEPEMARWNVFFGVAAPLFARAPYMVAMGNHEEDTFYFWDAFAFPEPDAPHVDHYFFRYGHVHFTVLYTGVTDGYDFEGILDTQTPWLEQVLADADADPRIRFKVVLLHRGPLSEGANHQTDGMAFFESETPTRDAWREVWRRYAVDLVLAGHNHNFTLAEEDGVHVVTSCAGAPVHDLREDRRPTTLHAERTCAAGLFSVGERTISWTFVRADGSEIREAALVLCHEADDCAEAENPCLGSVAWACERNECIPECFPGVDLDAGTASDASVPDAEVPDAAQSDAGRDSGVRRDAGDGLDGGDAKGRSKDCGCVVPGTRASTSAPGALAFVVFALACVALRHRSRRTRRAGEVR